jgi:hypothetical protein
MIKGTAFAAGAAVTIGGTAPTNVVIVNDTTIAATTAQHAAGVADVVVSAGTTQASLPSGFTFTAPSNATNTPPVIDGLRVQGMRRNQPASMADLNETIAVTAFVRDAETPLESLTFQWTSTAGTFEGTGATVTWRAPASVARVPSTETLTLSVIERYTAPDARGLPVTQENRVDRTTDVIVHDSVNEVQKLGSDFLTMFSIDSVPPEQVVGQFSDSCPGKAAEFKDTADIRRDYVHTAYMIANQTTTTDFGGVCTFKGLVFHVDACARFSVRWETIRKADGARAVTTGVDHVTAVYERNRWALCDSEYLDSSAATPSSIFDAMKAVRWFLPQPPP